MVRTPREKDAAAAAGGSGRTGAIRAGWPYVLLLVLLGAGLVAVHLGFGNAARRDFQKLLSTMADQQRAAIEAYLDQRIADAAVFAAFPTVRAAVAPNEPLSGELEEHLATVLQAGRTEWGSVAVQVLDAEGAVRAGSGPELPEAAALLAGAGGRAVVVTLAGEGAGSRLLVSARVRAPDGHLRGWVLLADDPARSLWRILRREPITSRTGEALLVADGGGSPVFLSPLRGLPPGVRPAPEALAARGLAARRALEGEESFGEFVDYRGEKVWAAVRRIARTRWGLVVKIDRAEALHGLASGRRWASLALVSLALAAAATIRAIRTSERLRAAAELQRRDERHRLVLEQARDAIVWHRPGDGRILEANGAATELWGRTREELLAGSLFDLLAEEDAAEARLKMSGARRVGGLIRTRGRRRDGSLFPADISARAVLLDGEEVLISVVRDVSAAEAALGQIRFLNRVLRTLTAVDQVLVEAHDREVVLRRTCEEIVATGGFLAAWFGARGEGGRIVPAASAGAFSGYFDEVTITGDPGPLGRGPVGTAFREGRTVVVDDWTTDPIVEPWREAAKRRGFRSGASCVVRTGEETIGVLTVYADRAGAFPPEAVLLLEELARDLGLALELIEAGERRLKAEESLAASEARYRMLFEDNPAPMWVFDVETLRFLAVNEAAVNLYGYTRDEFLGMTLREIRPPGDAAPLQADVEVPRTGVRSSGPWRHQRKDGRTLLVEIVTHDVSFEGRAARLVLVGDVTERVRAEEKLRAFFDSGMVGAFLADGNGRITTANDELLRIVGRTRADAEAGALSWQGLTPPEWLEVDVARAAEARERGVCTPYEKEYLRKDGSRVPVLVGFALVGESREESVAFVLDLTERKATEEEVRRLNAELEARVERRTEELVAKSRELESFAYSVSHDLRAPLRAIDGFTRMIEEDHAASLEAEGRRLLGVVREAARRMGRLIDDLLAFSRAGRQDLKRTRVDVGELVRSVVSEVLPEDDRQRTDVSIGDLPDVAADAALLRQVFVNLLSNAVKFSATRPRRSIVVTGRREDGRVVYDVEDNGVGFDMAYAGKLFGVFQRLHGREFEGTGVGLALAERIVSRHGGTISAWGELDRGARFTVSIPEAGGEE
ncbi:MAG: PAS domain S-box protein [Thermoanaerobaculia bacterium]|nr:PAS domain S-box protein [Thermoanaerobaculia bacterium]